MTSPASTDPLLAGLERIDTYLRAREFPAARAAGLEFVNANAGNVDGWILLGRAHFELGQFDKALASVERALDIDAKHPVARLLKIDSLLHCGRNDEAHAIAAALEGDRKFDPAILAQIGLFYTRTNRHSSAARVYERVRVLKPADRGVVYNLASAYIALGEMDKAEALFDGLLRRDPSEYDAYYNRATLRKQTAERNHIAQLEGALARLNFGDAAESIVCYSLAKELEDVRDWKHSFQYLRRGASARRLSLTYHVESDLGMMDEVARQFDASFFEAAASGYSDEAPIFVLGLPRSGTTLVDRILSSHRNVGSVGESEEFSATIARHGQQFGPKEKLEIRHTKLLDFPSVGRDYCRSINGLLPGYSRLLDKTPRNYMYIGLILTALPNAKIVHLRRHPVDSCYAIYKTLFREGCLYSYDQGDLGRYYLGYHKLMAHWRSVLPGRFLDVSYEELVEKQEEITRKMVSFSGLEWEDACLSFEKNASPSLTASAAQVRQPIYKTSVALWRRYENELQPLIKILRDGGIDID